LSDATKLVWVEEAIIHYCVNSHAEFKGVTGCDWLKYVKTLKVAETTIGDNKYR